MQATAQYEAVPYTPTAERAAIVSRIMREMLQFETIFTDYQRGCEGTCGACDNCMRALHCISYVLAHADSRSWEVWREDELVGILMLTRVVPGMDAEAHYVFFDGKLTDKTSLLEEMIQWTFEDHEDWQALKRLTLVVPDFAYTLAHHAQRKLGFGGGFSYNLNGKRLQVEGIKRAAYRWRGIDRDMLVLGRLR